MRGSRGGVIGLRDRHRVRVQGARLRSIESQGRGSTISLRISDPILHIFSGECLFAWPGAAPGFPVGRCLQTGSQRRLQHQAPLRNPHFGRGADLFNDPFDKIVEDLQLVFEHLDEISSGSTRMTSFGSTSCQQTMSTQLRCET
jgi:hypothetical protein